LNTEQETTFKLFNDLKNTNQRIVYCGGEGGTGKSQIINAIADYLDKINNKNPKSHIMQSKWKDVDHLIFDEVSFIGQWVLNRVHQSIMTSKNSNSNFSGINILFCVVFCQLPSVKKSFIQIKIYTKLIQ
jgi:nicotinamide riboside kinase